MSETTEKPGDQTWLSWLSDEVINNPVNTVLIIAIVYLIYKILKQNTDSSQSNYQPEPQLEPLKKQDFTLAQLREYDGTKNEGRVLVAVNGKVFDVTKGKRFYGPGGPYASFAGRDASRGLATFSVEALSDDHDDLSDLQPSEMEQIREWELQFSEKYTLIGKLLKPGEEPTSYSDEEDDEISDKKND